MQTLRQAGLVVDRRDAQWVRYRLNPDLAPATRQLIPVAEAVTALFPVDRHSHTDEAIAFFFYDVPKVMMLLTLIVFAVGEVRSYFSP